MSASLAAETPVRILAPQVAGRFYPAETAALRDLIGASWAKRAENPIVNPKFVVAPHAGYVFSGAIAATAFSALDPRLVTRVVVIGPAHKFAFKGIAIPDVDVWQTPLGRVPLARDAIARALKVDGVSLANEPHLGEHSLETHLPFLQIRLGTFDIVPMLVGDARPETVAAALEAVWGGPETVISVSSDLSHFLDQAKAKASDNDARARIEALNPEPLGGARACGHRVLDGALLIARKLDLRFTGLDLRTSGDTQGNPERVVGYGAFTGEYAASAELPEEHRDILLDLAAAALRFAARNGGRVPEAVINGKLPMPLTARRAAFVTLTQAGRLRGCIGSLAPQRPLAGDVIVNAVKAGFNDPRFKPLTVDEIDGLDLSVSILSHPRPMSFTSEEDLIRQIRPDVDGLMLADQGKGGLFLPSVWKGLPDVRAFWRGLKGKAGLPADHWSPTVQVRRYVTESFDGSLKRLDRPVPVRFR